MKADQAPEVFTHRAKVLLSGTIDEVFSFAANPCNDHYWRNEVRDMSLDGGFEVGSILKETAFLPMNPKFITVTKITELKLNKKIVVETFGDSTYFRVERSFKEIDDTVEMSYSLKADIKMVKEILGFSLPLSISKAYYATVVKIYVDNLKRFIENNDISKF